MANSRINPFIVISLAMLLAACSGNKDSRDESPRIVNIINFIRYTEPRNDEITEDVLYRTVLSQAEDLRAKDLIGTYLLQYDALIEPAYQALMKEEKERGCEIGGWWEITQPHVEDASMTWRGEFPWDWRANVGFSVGYTPSEREVLVDVYMNKFKEIFGEYPKSIGSWFIDAHSLAYMYDKYGIEASCVCKEQVGTDGYTIWGGYWDGAFYPSRQNANMPAQTQEGAIGLPVFRMLGSDPIHQYEAGVGGAMQHVVSLEPVYRDGGGSAEWVNWFFSTFTGDPCLGYTYVQVGQENSFTWDGMRKGFLYQTSKLVQLRSEGKVRIETLAESGRWFKEKYKVTPPTSYTCIGDSKGADLKTVWFNSRFFRANLLWDNKGLKFRDIHLFDERLRSPYMDTPDSLPVFRYETLPIVDGCLWSSESKLASLRVNAPQFEGADPVFTNLKEDKGQRIEWPSKDGKGSFAITLLEDRIDISSKGTGKWSLDLTCAPSATLPFTEITPDAIRASYLGVTYGVLVEKGSVVDQRAEAPGKVLSINPDNTDKNENIQNLSLILRADGLRGDDLVSPTK